MRSVVGVVLGYVVLGALIGLKFAVLQQYVPSAFTDPGWLAFIVLTDALSALLGGYVLASVVRRRPIFHALALVAVLVLLGAANAVANAGQEPLWFQLATLAALSGALPLGAWLRVRAQPQQPLRTAPA